MHGEPASAKDGGLRIIGAGFGRTGTFSMKTALETLGFGPCYHMVEVIGHPARNAQWAGIIAGQPADWPAVFAGFHACVDWPACSFYAPLMDMYPNAKVLLTLRDPDAWYESVRATIYRTRELARTLPAEDAPDDAQDRSEAQTEAQVMAGRRAHARMVSALIWQQTFDGRFEDRDYALSVFHAHNDAVKRRVPADRLLVYETGSGWEPLCAFLGVAVPVEPFPRLNDRAEFVARVHERAAAERSTSGAD